MIGPVFQVWFYSFADIPHDRQGNFSMIEFDAPDYAAALTQLRGRDLIVARRLTTRRGSSAIERVVTDRAMIAFRPDAVARAQAVTVDLVDDESE